MTSRSAGGKSTPNTGLKAEPVTIPFERIDAVVFDMDGVVTDTAVVHATAWKRLFDEYLDDTVGRAGGGWRPFDSEDYRRYVDGKPRYDGVRGFLESRAIDLPEGDPSDPPGRETVCGLGNRKDEYFLEELNRGGARAFPSTVDLVRDLTAAGLGTAVISASRNMAAVLESAGIDMLFPVRVDGVDAESLGIPGKPDPAIFLEAARRLGVDPAGTVVVEDSLAGVEAGRRGGFGMVIGVDRTGNPEALREAGADVVVPDLSAVHLGRATTEDRSDPVPISDLPSALEHLEDIRRLARDRRVAVFLDYDGTLTPIVDHPANAVLPEPTRDALQQLTATLPLAVVSGRDLDDVRTMVGLSGVWYAGSHGFDIAGPSGERVEKSSELLPNLDAAETELRTALAGAPGAWVERKRFALAAHYRQVEDDRVPEVEAAIDRVAATHPELRKTGGKKVFELRPAMPWDKGKALEFLFEAMGIDGPDLFPLYLGDDETDEDAFRVIRDRGLGVAVRGERDERPTHARYSLNDPAEVPRLLLALSEPDGAWTLVYEGFDPQQQGLRESLCSLGNGFVETRGALSEVDGDDIHGPGTYLAGGYSRLVSEVAGRAVENEDLVNLPNWLPLTFRRPGEGWLDMRSVDVLHHRQELDVRRGVLTRSSRFRHPDGGVTSIRERRIVSMHQPHLLALETTVTADWSGRLEIRSSLDGRVQNRGVARYRSLRGDHLVPLSTKEIDGETVALEVETRGSHLRIAQAARTRVLRDRDDLHPERRLLQEPGFVGHELHVELEAGVPITVEKVVTLFSSRDHGIHDPLSSAVTWIGRAAGFDALLAEHASHWNRVWNRFDMRMEGQESGWAQRVLRLHVLHLLQTVSENTIDLDVGVPARGLNGEAYRGHVFWDELFIFPFLNMHMPVLTRTLLGYRFRRLAEARWAAAAEGLEGAMYPWQSGSTGREESQVVHLNPRSGRWLPDHTRLQRHVGLAIAFNAWQYYQVTADREFLRFRGGPMIIEIARFFASLGSYDQARDRYEIRGVIGPDEYHDAYPGATEAGVNNNAYTNVMAAWALSRAGEVLDVLQPYQRGELARELRLTTADVERWGEISRKLLVPFNPDGTISQFEGWDDLEELDWTGYVERYGNIQRLDRILEAEGDTANRYKLCKQADALMLFYVFSPEELRELFEQLGYAFDPASDIPRNVEYYLSRTAHGSTLSRVVHSWVLARIDRQRSWSLFLDALRSDVEDVQGGTTAEGIHLGGMAGSVDLVQRCFGGVHARGDVLWIDPLLPDEVSRMEFDVHYRGHRLSLQIEPGRLRVSARPGTGPPIPVGLAGSLVHLRPGDEREVSLPSGGAGNEP